MSFDPKPPAGLTPLGAAMKLVEQPQPVRTALSWLTGAVTIALAAIPLFQVFGVIDWTAEQVSQVTLFLGVVTSTVGGKVALDYARNRVTPTESPRDDSGAPLVPAVRSVDGI